MVGDDIRAGAIAEGNHRVRDGDGTKTDADGGTDTHAAGKQRQATAHGQPQRHDGGLEGLNGDADGEGGGVENGDGVFGDTLEEFGHDIWAETGDDRDTDATSGKWPDDRAQKVNRLTGVELEKRGIGGGEAALDVQWIDAFGKQPAKGLADGAPIDTANEAIGIVVGDPIFLQTLGEDFRWEGETAEEEGVKLKDDGRHGVYRRDGGREGGRA